jgi:hypothetical protein
MMYWQKIRDPRAILTFSLSGLAVFVIGASIPILPPIYSVGLAAFILLPILVVVMGRLPEITVIPQKPLTWALFASIFIYFVWPRSAFIPISALPVKHPQKMLYFALIAFWVFLLFKCPPLRQRLIARIKLAPALMMLWGMLIVWQIVTVITGDELLYSAFRLFIDITVVYLLLPIAISVLEDEESVLKLFYLLILAAVINCIYALPETLLRRNIFEKVTTLADIDPRMAKQYLAAKLRGGHYRAQASFDHPLLFAEYLLLMLPFSLVLAIKGRKFRRLMVCASFVIICGLVLSRSRVALVVGAGVISILIVAYLFASARGSKRNPWPLVITLLVIPLFLGAAYFVASELGQITVGRTATEASSSNARAAMLWEGLKVLGNQPIFGYGPGVGGFVLNYQNSDGAMTLDNYLLAFALDSGIVGLILLLSVFALAYIAIVKGGPQVVPAAYVLPALLASLTAFIVVKTILGTGLNNLMLALLIAAVVVIREPRGGDAQKKMKYA